MTYNCDLCKTTYKSYQSLWNHNNKFHKHNEIQLVDNNKQVEDKKYSCTKCKKSFKHFQSRWRHEKSCEVNEINIIDTINEMKTKISQLETKPSIVNYNTTHNTNNTQNIIIASPPGLETIENINSQQKKFIMNKGLSSLLYLIETTNFDKNAPQNHSYCVTALNDKHASMIDTKTNSIVKTEKVELFDKVLAGSLKKLEQFSNDKSFTSKERTEFIDVVERLKNILFNEKRGIKKYYNEINLLSYNNKDLILDTWDSLKKLDEIVMSNNFLSPCGFDNLEYQSDSSDIESDDEVNSKKLAAFRKKFPPKKHNYNQNIKPIIESTNSDSELEPSHSDSDEDEVCEIIIRGRQFILENDKVFVKKSNGSKGSLYGIYSNGKVKKNKEMVV
jgi:hypothetical protein